MRVCGERRGCAHRRGCVQLVFAGIRCQRLVMSVADDGQARHGRADEQHSTKDRLDSHVCRHPLPLAPTGLLRFLTATTMSVLAHSMIRRALKALHSSSDRGGHDLDGNSEYVGRNDPLG